MNTPDHVSGKPSNACWLFGKMNYASMRFREVKALCPSFVLQLHCDSNQDAVGPGLPCAVHSAFYRTGEIQGEEGEPDTAPFGCLPVQYFGTTSTGLRKKCLYVKGLATRTKLFIRILKEECAKM